MNINTLCIHGSNVYRNDTGAISVPIFQNATFAHPGVGQSTGYDYSRIQNPTREHLEETIAQLEHGNEALAFSSGMAAVTALFETIFTVAHTGCLTAFPLIMSCSSRRSTPRIQQRSRALSHLSPKLFLSKRRPTP